MGFSVSSILVCLFIEFIESESFQILLIYRWLILFMLMRIQLTPCSKASTFMCLSSCNSRNKLASLAMIDCSQRQHWGLRACIHPYSNILPIHTLITTGWVCLRCCCNDFRKYSTWESLVLCHPIQLL